MLFGPEDLLEMREDVMLAIYVSSVACKIIVVLFSFLSCIFGTFSYRCKIISKSLSTILGIDYSIRGECSWHTGGYSFR